MLLDLRKRMRAADEDVGEALVVPQKHVVRGFSCLIRFCSSSSASVSVRVVRNIIDAVSRIIRAMRGLCPVGLA
jgi:hypothetical protein